MVEIEYSTSITLCLSVTYIYIEIVYICDLLTRRNDLRTDRPEESVAATSSNNDSETMMKSNMFQPS